MQIASFLCRRARAFGIRFKSTTSSELAYKKPQIRVRFAPSPTGPLHLGGLRTALFNYLFAKRNNGVFILRIEDTDKAREVPGSADQILQDLEWAGIRPDEGYGVGGPCAPYVQSLRNECYQQAAFQLIKSGLAYRCFLTAEEIEKLRSDQSSIHRGFIFKKRKYAAVLKESEARQGGDFTIRLDSDMAASILDPGLPAHVDDSDIFTTDIVVRDMLHGLVRTPISQVDDCVLVKSDGNPTYHLANVVDDSAMGITHVLRGEEWLTSAPKHLLLYRALARPAPLFAHLPLLLHPDGGKLSKRRHPAAATAWLRHQTYLPEAVVGFVSGLGWSPPEELCSLARMAEGFAIEDLHAAPAAVDLDKLDSLQARAFRRRIDQACPHLAADLLRDLAAALAAAPPSCPAAAADAARRAADPAYALGALRVARDRVARRADLTAHHLYLWADPPPAPADAAPAALEDHEVLAALLRAADRLDAAVALGESGEGLPMPKRGGLLRVVRRALTGADGGPAIEDILGLLGPAVAARRLRRFAAMSSERAAA